jgi:hypothetical protein
LEGSLTGKRPKQARKAEIKLIGCVHGVNIKVTSLKSRRIKVTPRCQWVVVRGLIIWRRGPDLRAKPESTPKVDVRRCCSRGAGRSGPVVWNGLRCFSDARRDPQKRVWLGDCESLHRRAPEKWKNNINLRSASALDLRARCISARRKFAVLVSEPASGSTNGYLEER